MQFKKLFGINGEAHHILPKCLGTNEDRDSLENISFLTCREHFVVHKLLCKMFSDVVIKGKMILAITMFCKTAKGRIISSLQYDSAKVAAKSLRRVKQSVNGEIIIVHKDDISDGYVDYKVGRKHSSETRVKISKGNKGLKRTEENKKLISKIRKGMKLGPQSPEHSAKIGDRLRGKKKSIYHVAKISHQIELTEADSGDSVLYPSISAAIRQNKYISAYWMFNMLKGKETKLKCGKRFYVRLISSTST